MNNSKLIHDYLDGKLQQPGQDMLFAELANNAELRNEFNQQMKMHMIAQNDMAMISPPAAATNAIFAELGFSIPPSGGAGDGAAGAGFGASFLAFMKRYLPGAATAVVSAVLTGLIIYWLLDFDRSNSASINSDVAADSKPVITSVEGSYSPIMYMQAQNNSLTEADVQRIINNAMARYMTKVDNYYKNYYTALINLSKNNRADNNRRDSYQNVENVPRSDFNMMDYLTDNSSTVTIQNNNRDMLIDNNGNSNLNNSQTLNPQMTPKEIISNFNLSFRGFSTRSNINVNVPSQSNPWFNNMGVGASYNLAKNHELGVEVGQESFPQKFNRQVYGEELTYYQNPILFWYGVTYRYSLKQIFVPNVFYPYFQVMGGFTKVGPLGRAQIGLSYSPDKRVTFNLGLEGTALWYNVQKTVYDTKKIGLTYGISISY
jgi:hypothetical protein